MDRRAMLAGSIAATVTPAAALTKGFPTFEDLRQAYSRFVELVYLHNEGVGVPNDRAEEFRYKRAQQVAAEVDLGMH